MVGQEWDSEAFSEDLARLRGRIRQTRMLGETDLEAVAERGRTLTEAEPIRLLYADDDERYRLLIAAVVRTYPRLLVIGIATNGEEAVALARQHRPNVVLLDVEMPTMDGITAARLIKEELPSTRVLLHTGELHDERRAAASREGFTIVDKLAIHATLVSLTAESSEPRD